MTDLVICITILDTPRQYWSANFIHVSLYVIMMMMMMMMMMV